MDGMPGIRGADEQGEERFRIAIEAVGGHIFDWDLGRGTVWRSVGLAPLIGFGEDEVPDDNDWWSERVHPDDRALQNRLGREAAARREPQVFSEYRVRHRDGRWIWVRSASRLFYGADGRVVRVLGCTFGIDDRRRAEEAQRRACSRAELVSSIAARLVMRGAAEPPEPASQLAQAIFAEVAREVGADACFSYAASCEARELRLVASAGLPHEDCMRFAVLRFGELVCGKVAERREAVVLDEAALLGFEGAWLLRARGMRACASVPMLSGNELVGTVAFATRARPEIPPEDLELIRTAADLMAAAIRQERLDAALSAANRQKDEFLAMLAHELRNPLAPIRTAGEVLAQALPADPRLQQAVAMIQRQSRQLTRLVDDLLDVSRITRGRIELERAPLALATIVDQAVETVAAQAAARRQRLLVQRPDPGLGVHGDATRLVQCLTNLLNNAVKFTPAGGEIRLRIEPAAGAVRIAVEDTGIGLAADFLPRVFDLFTQGEQALDRASGGLGIGLSVVRRLAEMHGGSIEAASDGPGRGATFTLTLPCFGLPAPQPASRPQLPVGTRRVLVVDDNQDAADSLAWLLRLDGHEVETAYSASAALEGVARGAPQVVLLDIGLPQMDGYEVARRIRAREAPAAPGATLVALTGYGQPEDRARALASGFDGHLVKPVDFDALREVLVGA
jgi:PAS domain S-box-containing protein